MLKGLKIFSRFLFGNKSIVDGKVIDAFQLSDMSPDQIESIDVLKGNTATARYGEKAKDGAILITTKPAKTGR